MSVRIPFCDKGQQSLGEMIQVREIADVQPLALHNAEPLLNLIHPRRVDRQKEAHEARVRLEPGLDLLPFMHAQVIKDQKDATNGGRNLPIQLGQQSDELFLSLPQCRSCVDLASPRSKGGKQMECSCSFVLVLQASREGRSSGER
jgi:hypothetical protein